MPVELALIFELSGRLKLSLNNTDARTSQARRNTSANLNSHVRNFGLLARFKRPSERGTQRNNEGGKTPSLGGVKEGVI
jgi:hypothetical protein